MLHCVCFKEIKFLWFDSETINISWHLVSWLFTFFVYNQLCLFTLTHFSPLLPHHFLSFLLFTKNIWSFLKANVWFNMFTPKSCSLVRCDDEVYENINMRNKNTSRFLGGNLGYHYFFLSKWEVALEKSTSAI